MWRAGEGSCVCVWEGARGGPGGTHGGDHTTQRGAAAHHAARAKLVKYAKNNRTLSTGASPRLGVMPAWREPPRHSIYDANTLNQKQRRASTKSTLLSCAAESANLPAQQRSETALAWGCWPLAVEQAASQRSPVPALRPQPRATHGAEPWTTVSKWA